LSRNHQVTKKIIAPDEHIEHIGTIKRHKKSTKSL